MKQPITSAWGDQGNDVILRRERKAGWRLYILPQYHASFTQLIKYNWRKAIVLQLIFVLVLTALLYARFKDFRTFLTFYENCESFRAPKILAKHTSCHLFSYRGLKVKFTVSDWFHGVPTIFLKNAKVLSKIPLSATSLSSEFTVWALVVF